MSLAGGRPPLRSVGDPEVLLEVVADPEVLLEVGGVEVPATLPPLFGGGGGGPEPLEDPEPCWGADGEGTTDKFKPD